MVMDDPHFLTWNSTYYDFMGECDLKLISAPHFVPDLALALDINIRTSIRYSYSFVESAVVHIGEDTLEVSSYGEYAVNGVESAPMPTVLAGAFPVTHTGNKKIHLFEIELEAGEKIVLKVYKDMVSIKFMGTEADRFVGSFGLLGNFDKHGMMLGRDGITSFDDPNAFGDEWQIKDNEDMLFVADREPQHPQKCVMPAPIKEETSRRLGGPVVIEAAEAACAHWPKPLMSACVHDVLATNDLELAQAGAF